MATCVAENDTQPQDLWQSDMQTQGPAKDIANTLAECSSQTSGVWSTNPACIYEEYMFQDNLLNVIDTQDPEIPLFMFWAPHSVHEPLEVPKPYWDKFDFIDKAPRRTYHAMVNFLDEMVGNVSKALQDKGMCDNTLVVFSSDFG